VGEYTRERSWSAWSGDLRALDRLSEKVEKAGNGTWSVKMKIRETEGSFSGDLARILPQFDRRTAKGVQFDARPTDARCRITVELAASDISPECRVRVIGSDDQMARTVFTELAEEVEKGVPRWARLPETRFALIVALAVSLVLVVALIPLTSPKGTLRPNWGSAVSVGVGSFGWVFVWLSIRREHSRIFPMFEVTGDGLSSSVNRRVVALLFLLASIPIGIFVNRIS
jgi:hypothetical protein